jgi:exopolyphosphatase/guanosine-5'-triphosphate,3'-diphosphate pyrophosphatase
LSGKQLFKFKLKIKIPSVLLGVLDVGSNTVHLQIMDAHQGAAPLPQNSFKVELRLTEYLDDDGAISQTGLEHLIEAIKNVYLEASRFELDDSLAFATSAIREATNSEEILATVRAVTGVDLQVLSGSDEARFTFLAVRRWLGWSAGDILMLDIGGGSLEIAHGEQEDPSSAFSFQLGAGRLTRNFLNGDPYTEKSLEKLKSHIKSVIDPIGQELGPLTKNYAIGTSKTFRSLRRIQSHYLPDYGNNLTLNGLNIMVPKLQKMSNKERMNLPGVSAGRACQIVAGAMVAQAAMKKLNLDYVVQCPWALREGIVLQRMDWIK